MSVQSTMLETARGMAGDHRERAAELIAETQSKNPPTDDEMLFNSISAQASVAAAQNKKDELHELLQRGFVSLGPSESVRSYPASRRECLRHYAS